MELKDKHLYYVGGVVRDKILGTGSFDTDFCYEGNAIDFAKDLNIIKKNPAFGTVRVIFDNKEIDIASTREEIYPKPGHLPVVKNIGCSLKEDLKRRDFTINALAENTVTGEITDYFNGLGDIKNKKLRILHEKSFTEDPTRIIRGLKFAVRFGFELEEETKKLQEEYLQNINYDMSFHRLKKELKETFNLNKDAAYCRFIGQGIYKLLGANQSVPNINYSIEEIVEEFKPNFPWLVYLGLFNLSNLELTAEELVIVKSVPGKVAENDFELYKLLSNLPLETILLYALSVDYSGAVHYLRDLIRIKPELRGDDLKSLGIKEGKIYKEIFDYIIREKLSRPDMDREQELELVRSKYCV